MAPGARRVTSPSGAAEEGGLDVYGWWCPFLFAASLCTHNHASRSSIRHCTYGLFSFRAVALRFLFLNTKSAPPTCFCAFCFGEQHTAKSFSNTKAFPTCFAVWDFLCFCEQHTATISAKVLRSIILFSPTNLSCVILFQHKSHLPSKGTPIRVCVSAAFWRGRCQSDVSGARGVMSPTAPAREG